MKKTSLIILALTFSSFSFAANVECSAVSEKLKCSFMLNNSSYVADSFKETAKSIKTAHKNLIENCAAPEGATNIQIVKPIIFSCSKTIKEDGVKIVKIVEGTNAEKVERAISQ